mmetsp:Transcript_4167/g.9727  ORF Transcript_4167/g.9727 Transcript_4167/m.9727 type:complete len:404 (-) Transcript_4167:117-1328(-)
MSGGQEFWIVASGCAKTQSGQAEKEDLFKSLKSHPALASRSTRGRDEAEGPWKFSVPDGERSLMFGSFDNLIRLTDELQKYDSHLEGIVHRFERQYLEVDPKAQFKVRSQRTEKSFMEYLQHWQWDDAKYPKTRSISDNLTLLITVVNKLDEEARNKTAQYNELKTQKGNLAKKESASLTNRDLVDLLTPDVVKMNGSPDDDFIYTEHLTTVVVILPRGTDQEFLKIYESMQENVVPMSAKHFSKLDDKDGNSLWRVVVFKSAAENFKKQCRERRFIPRDFEYSEETLKKLHGQRELVDEAVKRHHELVRGLYQAAWSDGMIAWTHIKAMRIFVESVLRFGMPPTFASFIIIPKTGQNTVTRKALADILGKQNDKMTADAGDDGEEYYPYVSLSFTPFAVPRG